MKAISLIQPWATLWALGIKLCETRSWPTQFRGQLMIHASKSDSREGDVLWNDPLIRDYCIAKTGRVHESFSELPRGCIVGKVNIIGSIMMTPYMCKPILPFGDPINIHSSIYMTQVEHMCGDWKPGRFAFIGQDHQFFQTYLPAKGQLGIWEYDPDQIVRERVEKEEQERAKRQAAVIRRRIKRERQKISGSYSDIVSPDDYQRQINGQWIPNPYFENQQRALDSLRGALMSYREQVVFNARYGSYSDLVNDGRNGTEQKYSQQPVRPPAPDFDPTKPVKRKLRLE
jgi:hypothetical protein